MARVLKTKELVNNIVGDKITFEKYPHNDEFFSILKEKIIEMLNK